jgi:hypothetical protein
MHSIDGVWYRFDPAPRRMVTNPDTLKLSAGKGIVFPVFQSVASGGIYPTKTIQDLQETLLFTAERNALLNAMSRQALGRDIDSSVFMPSRMFTDADWDHMTGNFFTRMKNSLQTFGSYSSIFIAIVIIFMAIKAFIEGIMYGNLLKGLFNCWLVVLGSLWTGLGNSLLIRHERFVRSRGLPVQDLEAQIQPVVPNTRPNVSSDSDAVVPVVSSRLTDTTPLQFERSIV